MTTTPTHRKPLLDTSAPLYLKRLARELNSRTDGFYSDGLRYSAARIRRGQLQGYRAPSFVDPNDPRAASVNPWRNLTDLDLTTLTAAQAKDLCDWFKAAPCRRGVCASRTP